MHDNTTYETNKRPFFSIVIANYNYGRFLATAIESILHQNCDDYEIIIVDGKSHDNSVDVIKSYEKHLAWWVSEPDTGQSNAFNKGFSQAKGRFLTWLNADDILLPGTLEAVKKALLKKPEASWATGNLVRFLQSNGKIIEAPWGPHFLPGWLQGPGRVTVFFGPTTFWSREAYDRLGPLDETLHLAMDVDYWYRLDMAGYRQVRVNHPCWGFRMHAESKTAEYGEHEKSLSAQTAMAAEKKHIVEKNNYHPKKLWRHIGIALRCIDGSMIKGFLNKHTLVGADIREAYRIDWNISLGTGH